MRANSAALVGLKIIWNGRTAKGLRFGQESARVVSRDGLLCRAPENFQPVKLCCGPSSKGLRQFEPAHVAGGGGESVGLQGHALAHRAEHARQRLLVLHVEGEMLAAFE